MRRWLTVLADGLAWPSRHGKSATDIVLHQWWQTADQQITRRAHTAIATLPVIALLTIAAANRSLELGILGIVLVPFARTAGGFDSPPGRLNIRRATRQGLFGLLFGLLFGARRRLRVGARRRPRDRARIGVPGRDRGRRAC